jgi:hypothetical protein
MTGKPRVVLHAAGNDQNQQDVDHQTAGLASALAQRDHRIHGGGAARRNDAGDERCK